MSSLIVLCRELAVLYGLAGRNRRRHDIAATVCSSDVLFICLGSIEMERDFPLATLIIAMGMWWITRIVVAAEGMQISCAAGRSSRRRL